METSSRKNYENIILQEVKDLPEPELKKIIKIIHFLKEEILQNKNHEEDLQLFWKSFGSWQDERSAEEIIHEIYESRKSSSKDIKL